MSSSGGQLAGEAPTAYTRFGHKLMEPWTDDLIRSAHCRDGDRVLDVACGTGIVANHVNAVSGKWCAIGTVQRLGVTPPPPMTGAAGRELARRGGRSPNRTCRCRRQSGPEAAGRRRVGTSASAATWPCAG